MCICVTILGGRHHPRSVHATECGGAFGDVVTRGVDVPILCSVISCCMLWCAVARCDVVFMAVI